MILTSFKDGQYGREGERDEVGAADYDEIAHLNEFNNITLRGSRQI